MMGLGHHPKHLSRVEEHRISQRVEPKVPRSIPWRRRCLDHAIASNFARTGAVTSIYWQ